MTKLKYLRIFVCFIVLSSILVGCGDNVVIHLDGTPKERRENMKTLLESYDSDAERLEVITYLIQADLKKLDGVNSSQLLKLARDNWFKKNNNISRTLEFTMKGFDRATRSLKYDDYCDNSKFVPMPKVMDRKQDLYIQVDKNKEIMSRIKYTCTPSDNKNNIDVTIQNNSNVHIASFQINAVTDRNNYSDVTKVQGGIAPGETIKVPVQIYASNRVLKEGAFCFINNMAYIDSDSDKEVSATFYQEYRYYLDATSEFHEFYKAKMLDAYQNNEEVTSSIVNICKLKNTVIPKISNYITDFYKNLDLDKNIEGDKK